MPPANQPGGAPEVTVTAEARAATPAAAATPATTPAPDPAPAPAATPTRTEAEIRAEAAQQERERLEGIRSAGEAMGLDAQQIRTLQADGSLTLDAAKLRMVDMRAETAAAKGGTQQQRVVIGQDETQTRLDSAVDGLLYRIAPTKYDKDGRGKNYRQARVQDIGREVLRWRGVDVGYGVSPNELWKRVNATPDFPYIINSLGNKRLADVYAEVLRTFEPFSRRTTHSDFKGMNVASLGGGTELKETPEGGTVTFATFAEDNEFFALSTYTRGFYFTRQMFINDDLGAFDRVATQAGGGAARTENTVWWKMINDNPKMADGKAIFHSDHKNFNNTGGAPTIKNIAAAATALAKQTGLGGEDILLESEHLVVPISIEDETEQQLKNTVVVTGAGKGEVITNRVARHQLHGERKIDTGNPTDPWYLFVDPYKYASFEHAYLEGAEGVEAQSEYNFKDQRHEFVLILDFAAKCVDFRGAYKRTGAAFS